MYFSPSKKINELEEDFTLLINETPIKEVTQTKFFGVIIDNKLTWVPHIKQLVTKLRSCIGRIHRIKNLIPQNLHKDIYHTLFESHLTFGISVWGGVSMNTLAPLFTTQKKCVRLLFGDNEAYSDKFKTCVRTRPIHCIKPLDDKLSWKVDLRDQILGTKFFEKEHTKPLFVANDILTVHNLYRYHCLNETYKILKLRTPISLYTSLFNRSRLKETRLITPTPSVNFTYKSAHLWNTCQNVKCLKMHDLSSNTIGSFKHSLKKSLLSAQKCYNSVEWCGLEFTSFGQ